VLLNLSNHPGRIPRHNRIRWNISGDDCSCTHHAIATYPHPWQENRTTPYPNIVLDHYRLGFFPALDPSFRLKEVGGGIDLNARPNHDMVANMHLTCAAPMKLDTFGAVFSEH
jgi:hypothetical protein